jgi:hypothetical protein
MEAGMAVEAVKLLSKVDAQRKIRELADLTVQTGVSWRKEAEEIGRVWELPGVPQLFDTAEKLGAEPTEQEVSFKSAPQPIRVEDKAEVVEQKTEPPVGLKLQSMRKLAQAQPKPTDVVIPAGVDGIEALTYVPGLVGQIVEWIVAGARRPNRVMALGVALAVVGTLIGRRFEGPTGNATHLTFSSSHQQAGAKIIRCGAASS